MTINSREPRTEPLWEGLRSLLATVRVSPNDRSRIRKSFLRIFLGGLCFLNLTEGQARCEVMHHEQWKN